MVLHIYVAVIFNILLFILYSFILKPACDEHTIKGHAFGFCSQQNLHFLFMPLQIINSPLTEKKGVKIYHATTTNAVMTGLIEWDISVMYWTDSGLDRWGLIPEQRWNLSLHHHFQISSWACTGSCQMKVDTLLMIIITFIFRNSSA